MKRIVLLYVVTVLGEIPRILSDNTTDPVNRQLVDFKENHPVPIGLWTKSSGQPIDVRQTVSINTDVFANDLVIESFSHFTGEKIPERILHAKGIGAYGYFEVTNDVSKYTYADVFNDIGKRTPIVARFSVAVENRGGIDLNWDLRGVAVKFYTKQGNLDILCVQIPVYFYKDPLQFPDLLHAFTRNPVTNTFEFTSRWDALLTNPIYLHGTAWLLTDAGVPNGYRKMDAFAVHAFQVVNSHGEIHYVKFNFRTEQGVEGLTLEERAQILDPDYYTKDLYNAIERKDYPSWILEMDVMTEHDIRHVDFNPFDVTKMWKNGTYFTVPIGRLVLNKNADNWFKHIERSAFNPTNLVPGIPGPVDTLFKGRKVIYPDASKYRLGVNANKLTVNKPLYARTYNRDGLAPIRDNGRDAPNYYPNTFNGPIPFVDERMPTHEMLVLQDNAIDLEPLSILYNNILATEAEKQRFVDNVALLLAPTVPKTHEKAKKLFDLIDPELGQRLRVALLEQLARAEVRKIKIAQFGIPTSITRRSSHGV